MIKRERATTTPLACRTLLQAHTGQAFRKTHRGPSWSTTILDSSGLSLKVSHLNFLRTFSFFHVFNSSSVHSYVDFDACAAMAVRVGVGRAGLAEMKKKKSESESNQRLAVSFFRFVFL